jgi:cell division inhibitor SepF
VSVVDRILGFMGIESIEDEDDAADDVPDREETRSYRTREVSAPMEEHNQRPRRSALVSLPGGRTMRVVVAEPRSFDEVQPIADQLKERRPVVINLESVDKDTGQKFLNFLSGTIYALDGTMQRVSTSIFVFAPANVEIALREGEGARAAAYGR